MTWGHLDGVRVYLAGPRTCLDPAGYAALAAGLFDLGLIAHPVDAAFEAAAAELRALGAEVTSPHEQLWWRGAEVGVDELRTGRAANAAAPAAADLVVVLDGWLDVPGAVDIAVIAARTVGVPVLLVSEARQARAFRGSAALRRRQAA
ncbi:DUF4406 domain-containing protein [Sporichthya sp.]|uniref:DUF4406 domain-containing protein n=1 Tax=Sporichthya sp. TaxID=65475 RepID=UPI0017D3C658|nr:DUF4406 domain-containing protein [Sporichthya sp.]MBA3741581.1 hypothetical protein [Sporichthya sp.]